MATHTDMPINWPDIDTLLLDMDGTLLDLHFDNHFWLQHLPATFARKHNLSFEAAFADLSARFAARRGTLSWYCLDYWTNELSIDIAALKHDVADKIAIRPYVEAFLQQQRAAGRKLILLTNAHRKSLSLKMDITGIEPLFDALVSTHDYGMPKEDPKLWQALFTDFPINPARCLLIDDSEPILDCAKAAGIGHVLTLRQPDSQQALRQQLTHPAILHFDEIMQRV